MEDARRSKELASMNTDQFNRQLSALGSTFKQGSSHIKVYLNGR